MTRTRRRPIPVQSTDPARAGHGFLSRMPRLNDRDRDAARQARAQVTGEGATGGAERRDASAEGDGAA